MLLTVCRYHRYARSTRFESRIALRSPKDAGGKYKCPEKPMCFVSCICSLALYTLNAEPVTISTTQKVGRYLLLPYHTPWYSSIKIRIKQHFPRLFSHRFHALSKLTCVERFTRGCDVTKRICSIVSDICAPRDGTWPDQAMAPLHLRTISPGHPSPPEAKP